MVDDEHDEAAAMEEAAELDEIRDAAIAADQSEEEQARRIEAVAALVAEENRAAPSEPGTSAPPRPAPPVDGDDAE